MLQYQQNIITSTHIVILVTKTNDTDKTRRVSNQINSMLPKTIKNSYTECCVYLWTSLPSWTSLTELKYWRMFQRTAVLAGWLWGCGSTAAWLHVRLTKLPLLVRVSKWNGLAHDDPSKAARPPATLHVSIVTYFVHRYMIQAQKTKVTMRPKASVWAFHRYHWTHTYSPRLSVKSSFRLVVKYIEATLSRSDTFIKGIWKILSKCKIQAWITHYMQPLA